jgi:hypothetical protein
VNIESIIFLIIIVLFFVYAVIGAIMTFKKRFYINPIISILLMVGVLLVILLH